MGSQSLKMLINKMDGVGVSVHSSVCSTTTTTTTTTTRTNNNGTHTTTTTITQSTKSPNNMSLDHATSDAIPLGMGPLAKESVLPINGQLQQFMEKRINTQGNGKIRLENCKIISKKQKKRQMNGKKCVMNKIIIQNGKKKKRQKKQK